MNGSKDTSSVRNDNTLRKTTILGWQFRCDFGILRHDLGRQSVSATGSVSNGSYDRIGNNENVTIYISGEVAEWPKAAVLKTVEPKGSQGSNPCLSAKI